MPSWTTILTQVGSIAGEIVSLETIVAKITTAMDKSLAELTLAEAEISSDIVVTYRGLLRECRSLGAAYRRDSQLLLARWQEFKEQLAAWQQQQQQQQQQPALPRQLYSQLHWLQRGCQAVIENYLTYKEKLTETLTEATRLEGRCKVELDKASTAKANMHLVFGVAGVIAVVGGAVAVAALAGMVAGNAVAIGAAAAAAGSAAMFAAYNRIQRIQQLIEQLRKHQRLLEAGIGELGDSVDGGGEAKERQLDGEELGSIAEGLLLAEAAQRLAEQQQQQLEQLRL